MSREYYFYPAMKGKNGIEPLLWDGEGKPGMVTWCNGREIDLRGELMLGRDEFAPNCREYFADSYGDNAPTYVYGLTREYLEKESGGIVKGYAPLEVMADYYRGDIDLEELKYSLIPAEVYAELPDRSGYGQFAELDEGSLGYICMVLERIMDTWWQDGVIMLAVYSF